MTRAVRTALTRLRNWIAPSLRDDRSLLAARVWNAPVQPDDSAGPAQMQGHDGLDPELVPILGEFAWHSLTLDSRLAEVSEDHYAVVAKMLADADLGAPQDSRVLEVAAYAHTTGYLLYERLWMRTDLLDISPSTLRLGRRIAREQGLPTEGTTCVAGDFHDMPYADAQFNVVYICSALHHTWRWQRVLSEMLRVLAPGGMLLLENEPCRRRFCHYRFSANRIEQYGELEQALDRLGILRTVAEPFPGTRPESLFGMVENQTIPIATLCSVLAANCTPVAVTVNSDVCMGGLEQEMVARRREGKAACTRWLIGEMMRRVGEAGAATSEADRGMGFGLPSRDEIEKLCASTVEALVELPSDPSSADFRTGLADTFGASVRIAVRKNGVRRSVPAARLSRDCPTRDDVVYAFPRRIAHLLDPRTAVLPNIQSGSIEALNDVFPPTDWTMSVSAEGLRSLAPAKARPSFTVPVTRPGSLLILVRLHVVIDARPFRVMLCADDDELAGFDAYRTDSLLFRSIVHCPQCTSRLRLSIRARGLDVAAADDEAALFNVSYAGAFAL